MLIYRNLFKIKIQEKPFECVAIEKKRLRKRGLPEEDHKFFEFAGAFSNQTCAPQDQKVLILTKKGKLKGLEEVNIFLIHKSFCVFRRSIFYALLEIFI